MSYRTFKNMPKETDTPKETRNTRVVKLTSSEQKAEILNKSDGLCVIDYYADWCGPCVKFSSQFDKLSIKYPQCTFLKENVDDDLDYKAEDISSIPCFHLIKGGKLVQKMVGADLEKLDRYVYLHR